MTSYWQHDLDPIALEWGSFVLPWYWLVYLGGFFFVYLAADAYRRHFQLKFSKNDLIDVMLGAWFGIILGGRLFYIVFYNLNYFLQQPAEIMAIWNGGMSFHGGLLGAGLSILVICWRKQQNPLVYTDLFALFIPVVLGCGRIANFINGELVGRVTDVPWAVIFAKTYDELPRHPSQLYEAVGEGFIIAIIMAVVHRRYQQRGYLSALFILLYGIARFVVEFFRKADDQVGYYLGIFTLGHLLCAVMMVVGGVGLLWIWRRNREGVVDRR